MNKEPEETFNKEIQADWNINNRRVLVIPDVHHNVKWVKAIFEKEAGNYDTVVFLGDYFDSRLSPPRVGTNKEIAEFVLDLIKGKYGDVRLLLGNHDLAYLEVWRHTSKYRKPRIQYNACSGFTNNRAYEVNTILNWEHWKKIKLFHVANGWLLTHAGMRANYWRPFLSVEDNLNKLSQEFDEAINLVNFQPNPLFTVGYESGGSAAWGGPLWCRPQTFEDELPLPQIFGHTFCGISKAKKLGRCFNIDGAQSTYLIINPDGSLKFNSIVFDEGDVNGASYPVVTEIFLTRNEIRGKVEAALKDVERQDAARANK